MAGHQGITKESRFLDVFSGTETATLEIDLTPALSFPGEGVKESVFGSRSSDGICRTSVEMEPMTFGCSLSPGKESVRVRSVPMAFQQLTAKNGARRKA